MLGHRFDYSLKIVVIGDSGVGKTCLLLRFVRNEWDADSQPTLGVEFLAKVVNTDNHRIQLQLWDTAGQELFRSVTRGYYRGSAGALIVFDLTSRESFVNVDQWLRDLREVARPDLTIALIGNKVDLVALRDVSREEAQEYAERNKLAYFETSAKTGDFIESAVADCVVQIERKVNDGVFNPASNLEPPPFRAPPARALSCSC
jgi:small GTP-binding protein